MTKKNKFEYDAFISYSHRDSKWVKGVLLSRLENAGLKVFIDFRDFKVGASSIKEMERGVTQSRKTLLVLTPEYLKSDWTKFEALMTQTISPANRDLRVVPILRKNCSLPVSIGYMNYVDFANSKNKEFAWKRLVDAVVGRPPRSISKILVVDDELDVQKTIGGLLEDAKNEVFVSADENGALNIFREEQIDFAIIDICLHEDIPDDESGLNLAKAIHALASHIQTIILSGSTKPEHIISAFTDFGVIDYIVKTTGWEDRLLKVIRASSTKSKNK